MDLAWWRLQDTAPPILLPLVIGVVCGIAAGVVAALGSGVGIGIGDGLGAGILVGLSAGLPFRTVGRARGINVRLAPGISGGLLGAWQALWARD